jgi:hypothetical protein
MLSIFPVGYFSAIFLPSVFFFLGTHPSLSQKPFDYDPSINQLTFISAPWPHLTSEAYNSTKLAISSWLSASPHSKVILFVNRANFENLAEELEHRYELGRVNYVGPLKRDLADIPYVDDWFRQGIRLSQSTYVCFINADILLSANWFTKAKQVFHFMGDRPILLIGQRINVNLQPASFLNLSFKRSLLQEIDVLVKNSRHAKHSPIGIDSFCFRIDRLPFEPERIPPFVMGRYWWDNWMVGYATGRYNTITFRLTPPIYHINHTPHKLDPKVNRVAVNYYTRIANNNFYGSNLDTIWEVSGTFLFRRGNSIQVPLNLH